MGSSPKGGGGGGGNFKPPTVVPHTTSAPMTAAIKKTPVQTPLATSSMSAPLGFVPGQDGGPAIPQPYEYKNNGRNALARVASPEFKRFAAMNNRERLKLHGDRERASDSGYGSRGYAGGGGLY